MTHASDCEMDWPTVAAALEREVETILDALAVAKAEHIELKAAMVAKRKRRQ